MAVWLVRAGKYGDQEQAALDLNLVTIGWNDLPDLAALKDREAADSLFASLRPKESPMTRANKVGQV